MEALHTFPEKPIKILTERQNFQMSLLDESFDSLKDYMLTALNNLDTCSYEEREQVITSKVQEIGRQALTTMLSQYDPEVDVVSMGNQTYRKHIRSQKTYQSIMGPITINRHLYINRKSDGDGQTKCPLELRAGIIEGYWTPNAAKLGAFALAHVTPQEAEGLLLRLNTMCPSRSSLDRLPKVLQSHWQANEDDYYELLMADETVSSNAASVAVSLDGVMLAMKGKNKEKTSDKPGRCEWREASCGTISFFDKAGERLSTIQYGQMPEHKKVTLKNLLVKNIDTILQQRPDLDLIHIADGAQDNWTFFDEQMPIGFQLTDFYHACEYLKLAFDGAYKTNPEKIKQKYQHYRNILRHEKGGIDKVLNALRYLRDQHKKSEPISKALTYFRNNQHRMKYAEAKEKNYTIGSGVVEAACKSLVGQRLKRSGMSWCQHGGQAILNLRALVRSNRFDCAWKSLAENFKQSVTPHENVAIFTGKVLN